MSTRSRRQHRAFRESADGVWVICNDIDLVYSPDDNGYYFQQFRQDTVSENLCRTSQVFQAFDDAIEAYENKRVKWGEWN